MCVGLGGCIWTGRVGVLIKKKKGSEITILV